MVDMSSEDRRLKIETDHKINDKAELKTQLWCDTQSSGKWYMRL